MQKITELVNIRLPSQIVKWLDTLVERGIYKSRSEAIREFVRQVLQREND
ncbi:type II toxin-antitoxin system ParD family antitoxin [Candidatus Woesearchaeota archaeon]|nr:type II toxin-antitoxin system ParD family antitoxin [Candidatus Woesearchaeota archaeon]